MTEKRDDGGSAFPESYIGSDSPHEGIGNGMTLRDYFAAKAMPDVMADWREDRNINCEDTTFDEDVFSMAMACYLMADAMLRARKK